MALLTPQAPSLTGATPTYGAVSASDTVDINDGDHLVLIVKNGGGSPDTVGLVTPGTVSGLAIADGGGSVPAGAERWFSLPASVLVDPATGLATITHSFTTSVTCAVVRA